MRRTGRAIIFAVGVVGLVVAVNLTYKFDEWVGCDFGDHAETCIVRGLRSWFSATEYERFLVGGRDHETFVSEQKAACIAYHKEKKLGLSKSEDQLAVYCGCLANNLGAVATAPDLRYLARHGQPPSALQQRLDDLAPDCARLANSVGPSQPN